MIYQILQLGEGGSSSCIYESYDGEFADDAAAIAYAATLDQSQTYSIEALESTYRRIVNPAEVPPTSEEGIESERVQNLYAACMTWQSRASDPHTCDSNFFALLTSIKVVSKIAQTPVATKASACLAWLDTLWGDYYARKANGSTDYNFSSHGGCPFSFFEVREEAGE